MVKKHILIGIILTVLLFAGCSSNPPAQSNNSTQSQSTVQSEIKENAPTQTEDKASEASIPTRDNSSAELTTLFSGTFTVGEDIPEGRYVITGAGSGNLLVYEKELPIVNEILDDGSSGMNIGVSSVTTDIANGNVIEISGLNEVIFTPAETTISNSLTTGTWVVGLDIKAGKYDATCEDGESGNLFVYNGSIPVVNEILDKSGMGIGTEKVRVNLKDGQVITISGLNSVTFSEA